MKYRRRRAENIHFFLIFCWIITINLILLNHLFDLFNQLLDEPVYNQSLSEASEYLLIALLVFALACLIYSIINSIIMKISIKQYVYMKKFQKWLKEEKGMDYMPPLQKIKQKRIFDSIDLETFNL